MDVDAYLDRIGYRGARAPTLAALRELHVAHLRSVPFENLSIHAGEPIVLDEAALVDKIVRRRRGGFCYELNGAFAALLSALGFSVDRLAARVYGADGRLGIPFDHMVLRVDVGDAWLVDVGFGDGFVRPLRWRLGDEQRDGPRRYRFEPVDGGVRVVERRPTAPPKPLYWIDPTPRSLADFEPGRRYHTTSPHSPFLARRICSVLRDTGRVTVAGERLVFTTSHGTRVDFPLAGDAGVAHALRVHFGIDVDALSGRS
ncbi:MAG: arylamine N-acetyltransferase [Deltaproteobacteria bacterium]|nr:MAG: arylamine N-acetyltransferase [Deltaproteobacteria bacterium]